MKSSLPGVQSIEHYILLDPDMEIHALEGGGIPTVLLQSESPQGQEVGYAPITSAAATASSTSLSEPWLPEPQVALGGWTATI